MKIIHQLVLLTALLLGGCIKDDFRECSKMQNVIIKFRYQNFGIDVFDENISSIHLFVFNRDNEHFVLSKMIEQPTLRQLHETELNLPNGKYEVICWANASQNTEFYISNDESHLTDRVQTYITTGKANASDGCAQNGDKLYYAPNLDLKSFYIEVPAPSDTQYTMDFRTAHTTIDVYVTGFIDMLGYSTTNLSPSIELRNLTPKYDFRLNQFGEPITYKQTTSKKEIKGVNTEVASFNIPLCEKDNDVEIVLRKQSNNEILETVNLKKFMEEQCSHIDFFSPKTVNLTIEFKYFNGNITISIPSWANNEINPEI